MHLSSFGRASQYAFESLAEGAFLCASKDRYSPFFHFFLTQLSGRVCVPIRVSNLEKFNPLEVPTAASLVKELNEFDRANPNAKDENGKPLSSWKKTSMKEAISIFDEFLLGLENEARQKMVAKRGIQ